MFIWKLSVTQIKNKMKEKMTDVTSLCSFSIKTYASFHVGLKCKCPQGIKTLPSRMPQEGSIVYSKVTDCTAWDSINMLTN